MTTVWDAVRELLVEALQGVDALLNADHSGRKVIRVYTPGGRVLHAENPCFEIELDTIHSELMLMGGKLLITDWHCGGSTLLDPAEEGFQHQARAIVDTIVAGYRRRSQPMGPNT